MQVADDEALLIHFDAGHYYSLNPLGTRVVQWLVEEHEASRDAADLLDGPRTGYHAFVDFIWAKREERLSRLARKVDTKRFAGPGRLKGTHAIRGKA